MNFDPNTETWGANFQRTVKRKNEESLWTGWLRDEGLTRMSNAGRLAGISGISQGIGLDLKPYLLGAASNSPGRDRAGTDGDADIGLDVFYNVTPSLKANFTVNTDFAETEVDERRTNLTRFPLFFPEKREFFLDGSNFFSFPGGDESPFFSRRIGLNAGTPQPILYGAKLIGQAGRQDIGFLHVSTKDPYRAEVSFREVQAAYDPALGFTPRRNFRNWSPEINWQQRFSGHRWFRGVQISAEAGINLDLDNHVTIATCSSRRAELEFHSGDSIEFQMFRQTENLDEDFEISDGVTLPIGSSCDWLRYQVVYDGAEHRALSGRVEFSFGDFWNGSRRELNLDLTLRPRPGVSLQLSSEFNDVNLPQGSFVTKLIASTRARSSTRGSR